MAILFALFHKEVVSYEECVHGNKQKLPARILLKIEDHKRFEYCSQDTQGGLVF